MAQLMRLGLVCGLVGLVGARNVTRMKGITIKSWDGTILTADVHIPQAVSPDERLPVVIFANSWDMPQIEYLVQAIELAEEGYLVLEYETRGWYTSGGKVECAGPEDQRDSAAVIDFMLNQTQWQPDPQNVALAGISYGAGLALVAAAHDPRVKTVVAMSGWADLERALFEDFSPNLVWGEVLVQTGKVVSGRLDPELLILWKQLLIGNETAFRDWVKLRGVITYADALRARNVPLFLSNNLEDRIFKPQNMFEFFQAHTGPKKMLLNQGIHATSEIGGLLLLPNNHVWVEAKKWLGHYLQGKPLDGPQPSVDMQLRSDKRVRETFMSWPDSRIAQLTYTMSPRTGFALHGGLLPPSQRGSEAPVDNSITFARQTGMSAGFPIIGEILQVFVDRRITSNLLLASRDHAIWYYAPVSRTTRLCGTPQVSLDFTPSASKWQIVVYLYSVGFLDQGTLLTHGVMSCWNCTAGQRITRRFDLRTMCDDAKGGLGVGISLFSELYQPANTDSDLSVTFHYSPEFSLTVPEVLAGSSQDAFMPVVV